MISPYDEFKLHIFIIMYIIIIRTLFTDAHLFVTHYILCIIIEF